MAGFLEDILQVDTPLIFIISVVLSIVVAALSSFYWDYRGRQREHHRKEVNLKPIEDDDVATSSESEKNAPMSDEEDENDSVCSEDEKIECLKDMDSGAAGDEDSVGLLGQLKCARLKKIEGTLTEEQLKSEKEIEQEQLQAIFELLRKQQSDLDILPMNEDDLKAQLNMYR